MHSFTLKCAFALPDAKLFDPTLSQIWAFGAEAERVLQDREQCVVSVKAPADISGKDVRVKVTPRTLLVTVCICALSADCAVEVLEWAMLC
eukprot:2150593-Rhodomonas_salina.5